MEDSCAHEMVKIPPLPSVMFNVEFRTNCHTWSTQSNLFKIHDLLIFILGAINSYVDYANIGAIIRKMIDKCCLTSLKKYT